MDTRLFNERFPRSNRYHPEWIISSVSGGANPLWLTEWLSSSLELRPAMRVLDLGCGRAMSSIFLHREFGVQVWATDLWFSANENFSRIRHAGAQDAVFPLHCDARSLPYAESFFDAIVSIDSFPYYGTDELYLNYLAHFVKPGGIIAIAGAGVTTEFDEVPPSLQSWWEPNMYCLHSAAWWSRHWQRTGIVEIELADSMPEAWRFWLEWQREIAPHNLPEINALEADQGKSLTYIRCIARRRPGAGLDPIVTTIPSAHSPQPLLR
jgi:cyclopropane fatty-acyl-phospholipid synthase-like methyltransferase